MKWINGENVALILFFIGMYGLIARRNILKSIISLGIIQGSIILFFISIHHKDYNPPIYGAFKEFPSDPIPHGLMITAVVIGMSVTAVSLIMFITAYNILGTTNWNKMKQAKEEMNE
ncbi:MAG: cation:proton antiporter subunit C [Clostridia bacterium]|nr:cation:proton antiporter subunit C [Clostridia bacterium]